MTGSEPELADADPTAFEDAWRLRFVALIAVVATVLGIVVARGLRWHTSEKAELFWDRMTAIFAQALAFLLLSATFQRGYRVILRGGRQVFSRLLLLIGVVPVVFVGVVAAGDEFPIHKVALTGLGAGATLVALVASVSALRVRHLRVVGAILGVIAIAATLRLVAWHIAACAVDTDDLKLYATSRLLTTIAIVLEGMAQIAAATWAGTRARSGQLLSSFAIFAALVVTWGAAQGGHEGASLWQVVVHRSLAGVAGSPPPILVGALPVFVALVSVSLAFVMAVLGGTGGILMSAMAFILLGRGLHDVPLRALMVTTASLLVFGTAYNQRKVENRGVLT